MAALRLFNARCATSKLTVTSATTAALGARRCGTILFAQYAACSSIGQTSIKLPGLVQLRRAELEERLHHLHNLAPPPGASAAAKSELTLRVLGHSLVSRLE